MRTIFLSRRAVLKNIAVTLSVAACGGFPRPSRADAGKKTLILLYSWSGNTRSLARQIHDRIGGELVELLPTVPYTDNYNDCVDQAKKELAQNVFPPLQPLPVSVNDYDTILLGSPNWWGSWSGPARTFLHANNLAGKNVLPFSTHGGGAWQNMLRDLKAFCPEAVIRKGLTVRDGSVGKAGPQVDDWLKAAGLLA